MFVLDYADDKERAISHLIRQPRRIKTIFGIYHEASSACCVSKFLELRRFATAIRALHSPTVESRASAALASTYRDEARFHLELPLVCIKYKWSSLLSKQQHSQSKLVLRQTFRVPYNYPVLGVQSS